MVACEIKIKTHGKYLSKVNSCTRFAYFIIILLQMGSMRTLSFKCKTDGDDFTHVA